MELDAPTHKLLAVKILCGLHHIGVILVFSQANICRLGLIVRIAQLNLKVSHYCHRLARIELDLLKKFLLI